jgi:aspartyl-tRNA(Asn)/glutamyl-tRNA(Gln) amidotransferase subunit C
MALSEDIARAAKIARLNLAEDEKKRLASEAADVIDYFKVLSNVDTKNTVPAFRPVEVKDVLREDVVESCLSEEAVFKNAELKERKFFKSPRVV